MAKYFSFLAVNGGLFLQLSCMLTLRSLLVESVKIVRILGDMHGQMRKLQGWENFFVQEVDIGRYCRVI